ncbi:MULTISPECIES: T9SS type A sorting domain-containing protein [Aequorivita]|uniref:T9SS type A sorting domain-containing protein n=1 Tax=Aequorivita iocasae TaxID=2803865 RepID=A0ABX7DSM5_9FLAO|nr:MULTISPECIES: T9SS type A sorting domain-containing protein [Aequorivita]QQX76621.1 T9SS type A sorting domain-containing protein [Aequorivita iocasae]UCA56092.1 T9SS type A sorting domain-containing protein [Aequorivita sp. F7]
MKNLLLPLVFGLFSFSFFAQQIQQFRQLNGRYDYIAVGNTLNEGENNNGGGFCTILTESSANLTLLPSQTLVSAMLYWSGSAAGDFDVKLNGIDVSAQRTFSHVNNGLPYFAAYADVTSIVEAHGNGTYTFSDMDISGTLPTYCGTNYGGWSIIVVFEDPALLLNQIAVFDGLESVSINNTTLNIILNNIDISSDLLAKIGFLAWEGDAAIANGESLFINNVLIDNPPLNPGINAFNSTNSYTNSNQLFNMDMDYYDLIGIVQPGDTSMAIQLSSQQDFIMINNIITVVNSELPDPTIVIDGATAFPQQDQIQITYTVSNVNSTAILPSGVPITFYADGVEFGTVQTNQIVPIGGTISEVATIALPIGTPSNFSLKATINADGSISETDGTNNDFEILISVSPIVVNQNPDALVVCDTDNDGFTSFQLHQADSDIALGDPSLTITYHSSATDAENNLNVLSDPYINDSPFFDEVFARVVNSDESSFAVVTLPLVINNYPEIAQPNDIFIDEGDGDGFAIFNLTLNNAVMLAGLDPSEHIVSYFSTELDLQNNILILDPSNYINFINPQTIFVKVENVETNCFTETSFEIETDEILSMNSFAFDDLNIYPNPTYKTITVQSSQMVSETTISLYDIQGKVLLTEKIIPQNGMLTMNVSSLENGVYFVKISSEENNVIKKLIKN